MSFASVNMGRDQILSPVTCLIIIYGHFHFTATIYDLECFLEHQLETRIKAFGFRMIFLINEDL